MRLTESKRKHRFPWNSTATSAAAGVHTRHRRQRRKISNNFFSSLWWHRMNMQTWFRYVRFFSILFSGAHIFVVVVDDVLCGLHHLLAIHREFTYIIYNFLCGWRRRKNHGNGKNGFIYSPSRSHVKQLIRRYLVFVWFGCELINMSPVSSLVWYTDTPNATICQLYLFCHFTRFNFPIQSIPLSHFSKFWYRTIEERQTVKALEFH